jgi:hypothetical protein
MHVHLAVCFGLSVILLTTTTACGQDAGSDVPIEHQPAVGGEQPGSAKPARRGPAVVPAGSPGLDVKFGRTSREAANLLKKASQVGDGAAPRQGVLGRRLWAFEAGFVNGDAGGRDALDAGPDLLTKVNIPLLSQVDFDVNVTYAQRSGTRRVTRMVEETVLVTNEQTVVDLNYSMSSSATTTERIVYTTEERTETRTESIAIDLDTVPLVPGNMPVKPFVTLGAVYISEDADTDDGSDTLSEAGFIGGGGAEVRVGSHASLVPSAVRVEAGDVGDTRYNLLLTYWYTYGQGLRVNIDYSSDLESLSARVGWMCSY